MSALKVLTVVDWPEKGSWIWGHLPPYGDKEHYHIVSLSGVRAPRSFLEKSTLYRWRYLRAGLRVLPRLSDYDVVFSWEVKCGLPIALYQTLFRRSRPRHVVLGLILKGILARWPMLARWVLSSVAGVACFTTCEVEVCQRVLGLSPEQVRFIPLAWDVTEDEGIAPAEWDDYVLSVGSSNRDYETLFRAAEQIKARFIVVARPYNLEGLSIPSNVEVRCNISSVEVTRLLRRARLVVVPLYNTAYAAGQNVVLRAMSASRAVVVTRTPGIEDYVQHGQTGMFVPSGDVEGLVEAVKQLLNSADATQRLGMAARREAVARYSFAALSRHLSDWARELGTHHSGS